MKIKFLLILLLTGLIAIGCDSTSSGDDDDDRDPIVGKWLSEGQGQVAPGLAGPPFRTRKIDAEFFENQTYLVVSTDSSNATVTFRGNWVADEPNAQGIRAITLTQSEPSALTSRGIFRITDDEMEYEVIQTDPPIQGITAPNPADGFGSTKFNDFPLGQTWVQRYVRVN